MEGMLAAGPIADLNEDPMWVEWVAAYRKPFPDDFDLPSIHAFNYYTNTKAVLLDEPSEGLAPVIVDHLIKTFRQGAATRLDHVLSPRIRIDVMRRPGGGVRKCDDRNAAWQRPAVQRFGVRIGATDQPA
ncbi:hypothetical protein [Phyllobacterium salinisoli]|uniref:hypothetical protein n=1 Tax=Phyllobacterium salinisoli TaxID=1899321 RepID=UPI00190F8473|nr:hypothetical protein [Phyllobacterium salinisoli]